MNIKTVIPVAIFTVSLVFFGACKKNDTGPATSESQVSKDVFHDMFQHVFDDYSVYVGGRKAVPQEFSLKQAGGKHLFADRTNPLCGAVIDTALQKAADANADTALSFAGKLKLSFTCIGDAMIFFYTQGDLILNVSTPELLITSKIHENLETISENPGHFDTGFSIEGTLTSTGTYSYRNGSKNTGTRNFSYRLNHITIDPINYEIISGTIDFTTTGTGAKGSWNYTGVITAMGRNYARVTINGKAFDFTYRCKIIK